jgi:dynein assembly factor 2
MSNRNQLDGVTQEEVSKLQKAMKDEQFRSYMDEYQRETSDPANRKEYLQYLDQLEAKGEMPEGQGLLRTQPGCCVKTNILFKNGQMQKLFINIVHTDQLDDFRLEEAEVKGRRVHLPYSLSPPRPDRDLKDEYCMTCDLAVSSYTYYQSTQNPQIMKMLIDTAADGLGKQFLKGYEEVKKDYKVMQRLQCKGGQPMPMSVRRELLKDSGKKLPTKKASDLDTDAVTPSELKQMRQDVKKKKQDAEAQEEAEALAREAARESAKKPPKLEAAPRIRIPKHQLVHSGEINFTDFMETNQISKMPANSIPRVLKLIVELPTVKKVSDVNLEVTSLNVVVEVPEKYYLDLMLPYEVQDNDGTAKFDKSTSKLTLELPVKPKAPDMAQLEAANRMSAMGADFDKGEEDGALSEGRGASDDEDLPPLEDPPVIADPEPASVPEKPAVVAENAAVAEKKSGEWLECATNSLLVAETSAATAAAAGTVPDEFKNGSEFIASDFWDGARPGYAFKLGDAGLGYYRDSRQPSRPSQKEVLLRRPDEKKVDELMPSSAFVTEVHPPEKTEQSAPARAPLPAALQSFLDETKSLRTKLVAADYDDGADELLGQVSWHQTRQNLVLIIDLPVNHEARGVELRLSDRSLALSFGIRLKTAGPEARWRRQCLRRVLFGFADPQQWHADLEPHCGGSGEDQQRRLVVVLRKLDQTESWSEAFDTSVSFESFATAEANSAVASRMDHATVADELRAADVDGSVGAGTGVGLDRACTDGTGGSGGSGGDARSCPVVALADVGIADDSAALDAIVPAGDNSEEGTAGKVEQSAAAAAIAQSAAVMGQSVLLKTRLMYQLL